MKGVLLHILWGIAGKGGGGEVRWAGQQHLMLYSVLSLRSRRSAIAKSGNTQQHLDSHLAGDQRLLLHEGSNRCANRGVEGVAMLGRTMRFRSTAKVLANNKLEYC